MSEIPQNPEPPQKLIDPTTTTKTLYGFQLKEVFKTGSILHLLRQLGQSENKHLVRHGEIPAPSAAIWEFLYTYAQQLFPPDVAEKLFGGWGRAKVEPIVKKNGDDRVYYRGNQAVVYSEFAGYDTRKLIDELQINTVVEPYFLQNWRPIERRWLNSAAYFLAQDLFSQIPTLDPTHEIRNLLNHSWDEFARLNSPFIQRKDLLDHKELRRQDMDDDPYRASLDLVQTNHTIAKRIADLYRQLQTSPNAPLWKGVPSTSILLFLTHLSQTSAQQSVMWWLGISHGHLHELNAVSRGSNAQEANISPLVTSIIDFDQARISVRSLETSDLFSSINSYKLKQFIADSRLNPHLRMQMVFYLPTKQWDEEIVRFVTETNSPLTSNLIELVSLRAVTETQTSEQYNLLTNAVYAIEQKNPGAFFPPFRATLRMLQTNPEAIPTNSNLSFIVEYFTTRQLPPTDQLSGEQTNLLLAAIFLRYKGKNLSAEMNLTLDEISFMTDHLNPQDSALVSANDLLSEFVIFNNGDSLHELFYAAQPQQGNKQAQISAKRIVDHIYSPIHETHNGDENMKGIREMLTQMNLINCLIKTGDMDFALSLIDFTTSTKDEGFLLYKKLRKEIEESYTLIGNPQGKKQLIRKLKQYARRSLGIFYFLSH